MLKNMINVEVTLLLNVPICARFYKSVATNKTSKTFKGDKTVNWVVCNETELVELLFCFSHIQIKSSWQRFDVCNTNNFESKKRH